MSCWYTQPLLHCRTTAVFALLGVALCVFAEAGPARAYSANKVSFEARPNGIYRVYISYTVPALKEFREAFVEFSSRKQAESFYYDLLTGAEFYPDQANRREFIEPPRQPTPW